MYFCLALQISHFRTTLPLKTNLFRELWRMAIRGWASCWLLSWASLWWFLVVHLVGTLWLYSCIYYQWEFCNINNNKFTSVHKKTFMVNMHQLISHHFVSYHQEALECTILLQYIRLVNNIHSPLLYYFELFASSALLVYNKTSYIHLIKQKWVS